MFSPDVRPGEYGYAMLVEWEPWMEDVLATYASDFSICMIRDKDDAERIRTRIDGRFVPFESWDNYDEYAVLEFSMPAGCRLKNLLTMMLRLLSAGQAICYHTAEWQNPRTAIYVEKKKCESSCAGYIRQLFRGELTDSRYKETITNNLYWFTHPDSSRKDVTEVSRIHAFVVRMSTFYKRAVVRKVNDSWKNGFRK